MTFSLTDFIRDNTQIGCAPLIPEIKLYLATEVTPLWQMTEERLAEAGLPPPYWAFAWPGGQGMTRYLLDNPHVVKGRRILDFAAGCGIAAIAAKKAGAVTSLAVDIDIFAMTAMRMNAGLNGVAIEAVRGVDTTIAPADVDVIIAGDVCYEQSMAARMMRWFTLCREAGIEIYMADPGRAYVPYEGLQKCAEYVVSTSRDLEDRDQRDVIVWKME